MTPRFTAHHTALLRASAIAGSRGLPSWPDVPIESAQQDVWLGWLRQVWEHPVLASAIGDASPVLAQRLDLVCRGQGSDRDLVRVARSCARYVLRAQGRATPFGYFAGIAPLSFTSTTRGGVGASHRPMARVSTAWTTAASRVLESCSPSFASGLKLVTNNLATVRHGRVVLDHQPIHDSEHISRTSVRLTPALDLVLAHTRTPTPWPQVETALCEAFPGHAEDAHHMLAALVHQRILVSNLQPPMDAPDPVGHLLTEARAAGNHAHPTARNLVGALDRAHRALTEHDAAVDTDQRLRAKTRAREHLRRVAPDDPEVSVDLHLDSDLSLPRAVAWQAQGAAAVLARLAPSPQGSPTWRDYHRRFCERYGVGALVPLREVTDPDRGLGLPAGFRGSRLPQVRPDPLTERDKALLDLAHRASLEGRRELVLDEKTLDKVGNPAGASVLPHSEVRFHVHAGSRRALDSGDFQLEIAGLSRAAGTLTGRFLDLLSPEARNDLTAIYRRLPTLRENAIVTQLSAPTSSRRGDRVARTHRLLDWRLALGQHHPDDPDALSVDDLAVTADPDHLHLMSLTHGRPIEPVVFSAVELTRAAHPMQQFLAQITTTCVSQTNAFSWGTAAHLPFLPRVRWQQCVLAPARWRLETHDLPGPGTPLRQWSAALDQWRATYHVPSLVQVGTTDQLLHLDLEVPAHQQLLRTDLERAGSTHLSESAASEDLGWIEGRAHEIVATLTADVPPVRVRERPGAGRIHDPAAEHVPGGSGWWSLKLYGDPEHVRPLVTDALPQLSEAGTGRWWFLRYRDPDPHVRVRIRVDTFEHAEAVHAWSRRLREQGRIARIEHDTYIPETGRFGPGETMRAAEDLFVADSRAVIAQLAAEDDPEQISVWAAASAVDLTHRLFEDAQAARSWLIAHAPRTSPPREKAAQAIALTGPSTPLPASVQQAWLERGRALAAYAEELWKVGFEPARLLPDLLHLHCVRLFGPDPEAETQVLSLARACALSWNAREATR